MSEREQGACTTPHTRCCHHQSSSTLSGRCVHGSWVEIALIRLVSSSSVLYFLGVNTNTSHTRACVSLSKSSSFMYKSESRALFSLSHTLFLSISLFLSLSLSWFIYSCRDKASWCSMDQSYPHPSSVYSHSSDTQKWQNSGLDSADSANRIPTFATAS